MYLLVSTFKQELLLTIIDKGILAIAILIFGFFLNKILQKEKSKDSLQQAFISNRILMFQRLWDITKVTKRDRTEEITLDEKMKIYEKITNWYYTEGGGMFLSHTNSSYFTNAQDLLLDPNSTLDGLRSIFSKMKTNMKKEIKIYSQIQSNKPIISD